MSRALHGLVVLVPLVVAAGVLLRRGRPFRPASVWAVSLLAAQAAFWWLYAGAPAGAPEGAWLVGLAVAGVAVVTALSDTWGSRLLLWSAIAMPPSFVAYVVWRYEVAEGIPDGAGGQQPLASMALAGLLLGALLHSVPALFTRAVLRAGARPGGVWAPRPPGWYPDPDDPALTRFWNGTSWTELICSPHPTGEEASAAGAAPWRPTRSRSADRRTGTDLRVLRARKVDADDSVGHRRRRGGGRVPDREQGAVGCPTGRHRLAPPPR